MKNSGCHRPLIMLINENIMIKWLIWLRGVNVCERSERATENVKIRFTGKKLTGYREEKHFWKVRYETRRPSIDRSGEGKGALYHRQNHHHISIYANKDISLLNANFIPLYISNHCCSLDCLFSVKPSIQWFCDHLNFFLELFGTKTQWCDYTK